MAISRYGLGNALLDGKTVSSSSKMARITGAVENGSIQCSSLVMEEGQRLDTLAGSIYGSSSYWWIIAAASNIGWGLQVPPGTLLRIPRDLDQVMSIVL